MKLKQKYTFYQLLELNHVRFNGFLWGLVTGMAWILYWFILSSF